MINERWIAIDGSVYVELPRLKALSTVVKSIQPVRQAVAFNVGASVAEHIVSVHNESLEVKIQPY